MFYTKYRPQSFSEILRPNEAADSLSKQIKTGKTVHAYLFVGPRGTGKTSAARILAKSLNCSKVKANGDPCGKCVACEGIKNGSYMDLIEIDAASNRGIDDIRELKSKVSLAATHGKHKVYIIDEVHMLTKEAFNALLKTLEEPPKNVTFILCTTEANKVPATIKSRCQVYNFKRASIDQLVEKLKLITKEEGSKISESDLQKIAQASLGGYRDAETLLQQVIEGELSIESFSGLESREGYLVFIEYLLNNDTKAALGVIDDAFDEGLDLYVWVGELLKYVRELIFIKSGAEDLLRDLTDDLSKKIVVQAKEADIVWLVRAVDEFMDSQPKVKEVFIPQLPLEIAIVKLCTGIETSAPIGTVKEFDAGPSVISRGTDTPTKEVDGKISTKEDLEKAKESLEDNLPKELDKDTSELEITLKQVESDWKKFLKEIKLVNHSLLAIVKHCKPIRVEGNKVVFDVCYTFHKDRLETAKNKKLVEDALGEAYNKNLTFKCEINKKRAKELKTGRANVLTDYNVVVPKEDVEIDEKTIIESFDGGLPIV